MKNRALYLLLVPFVLILISGCGHLAGFWRAQGFYSPESVLVDTSTGRIFVSDIGKKIEPNTKDGDGFIAEISADGKMLDNRFLPKSGLLHAPKGMAIIGSVLYVADVDKVLGFDINTREQVFALDFSAEKTLFLNDIVAIDQRTLYVSATDIGKVFRVRLSDPPVYSAVAEKIPGPNGLCFDAQKNRLFVVGFGEGYSFNGGIGVIELNGSKPSYRALKGKIGALDGVALLTNNRLVFSDWVAFDKPGVLREYDPETGSISEIKTTEPIRGPADFYYDRASKKLYIPKMLEGKILIQRLD